MDKLGFDNDKYLSMQSERIKERINTLIIAAIPITNVPSDCVA